MAKKGSRKGLDGKFYPKDEVREKDREFRKMQAEHGELMKLGTIEQKPVPLPHIVDMPQVQGECDIKPIQVGKQAPEPRYEEIEPFPCPAIVGKAKSRERMYYFENRKQPGCPLEFFAGNAPVKGEGGKDGDIKKYRLEHGTEVSLNEEMAQHIRGKGTYKPIIEEDAFGSKPTGRTYLDRRFDLHEV